MLKYVPSCQVRCSWPLQLLKGVALWKMGASDLFGLQLKPNHKMPKKIPRFQKKGRYRAEFSQDAPFAIAIGACIFSSFVFHMQDDQGKNSEQGSPANEGADDVRNGAMTIISFIPLFNWLAWVFAWLDTNEQRYLFYAIVYLAPYVRNGFSLSPDDSWLPIASLLACIVHVQLDISLSTGSLQNEFLRDATNQLSEKVRPQELQEQFNKFMERIQKLAEKTEYPSSKLDDFALPSDEEHTEKELLDFDEKLAGLKGVKNIEKLESKEPDKVTEEKIE